MLCYHRLMVSVEQNNGITQVVLMPNRSMSWETNKKILLAMFCLNMVIALAWTYLGAWMVLPFAGLEILLVGVGMYYVSWKLSFREVLVFENESLIVQKGVYFPKQEWQWQKSNTTLLRQPSNYRMSAPHLWLSHLNEKVELGQFLNRKEKKQLRRELQELGLPLKNLPK